MVRFTVSAAVIALTLVTTGMAWAQDKPSGPYLRLDAGGSFTSGTNAAFGNLLQGEGFVVGGGVGYRVMPQLRLDVTVGYRGEYGFSRPGGPVAVRTDLDSVVGLATAYYDIVTIWGFTPYVGAGIGFAENQARTRRLAVSDVARASATASLPSDNTNTDFAWQATAGVSYSITPNWSLDFGYRYVDMGTVQAGSSGTTTGTSLFVTGASGAAATTTGVTNTTIKGDLQAHEIAIGLRYSF